MYTPYPLYCHTLFQFPDLMKDNFAMAVEDGFMQVTIVDFTVVDETMIEASIGKGKPRVNAVAWFLYHVPIMIKMYYK